MRSSLAADAVQHLEEGRNGRQFERYTFTHAYALRHRGAHLGICSQTERDGASVLWQAAAGRRQSCAADVSMLSVSVDLDPRHVFLLFNLAAPSMFNSSLACATG